MAKAKGKAKVEKTNGHVKVKVAASEVRQGQMVIQWVDTDSLRPAKYNPPGRVETRWVQELTALLASDGIMFYPILVTEDFEISDGHRRWTAAKKLGWKKVPVHVIPRMDQAQLYAEANGTVRRLTATEKLHVFLEKPEAMFGKQRKQFELAERRVTREMLERCRKAGFSISACDVAQRMCKFCGWDIDARIKDCLDWILRFSTAFMAKQMLERGTDPKLIRWAVGNRKPLVINFGKASEAA